MDLMWLEQAILSKFEGKNKGTLREPDDEIRVLNRVVRRVRSGYEWEADQRHAEILTRAAGLDSNSKGLSCPGRRLHNNEPGRDPELLSGPRATAYRANVARANFLAVDRPDIAFAVKELCRSMSSPSDADEEAFKRLARYLIRYPRMVLSFAWQRAPHTIDVYTDSDWAGCLRTRKSTSGGVLMRGGHLLRHWSSTQATVALSSAEAELISIVRGAAEGLGLRSLLQDLGLTANVRLSADASAALSICRRTGAGKVRHLDTRLLWVQDRVRHGELIVHKIPGRENPADVLTKHVSAEILAALLCVLACFPRTGRAKVAPHLGGGQ